MYSTTQQIAIKDFLPVPWNFEISRIGKVEVRGMTLPRHLFKYFNYRPKISGMMDSTIRQITGSNDHSRPILALSMEIWRFGTFPEYARTRAMDDVTALTFMDFRFTLKFSEMMPSTSKHIPTKMALPGHFVNVPRDGTWKFSMIGLGQENTIEEITLQPEIWWHYDVYHKADNCMKWPHWFSDLDRPMVLSISERIVFELLWFVICTCSTRSMSN